MVRKFVGKGGGCPDVGVRGSGVEGGLRPVLWGRPAKKKKNTTTTTTLFIQSRGKRENGRKRFTFKPFCIPLIIRSRRKMEKGPKSAESSTFCIPLIIRSRRKMAKGRYRLGARFARAHAHAHPPPRPRAPTPIPPPRFLPTSLDGSNIYF